MKSGRHRRARTRQLGRVQREIVAIGRRDPAGGVGSSGCRGAVPRRDGDLERGLAARPLQYEFLRDMSPELTGTKPGHISRR